MRVLLLFFILFSVFLTSTFYSQNSKDDKVFSNLNGVSAVYLRSGIKMNFTPNEYSTTVSEAEAETNFINALEVQYWLNNQWAIKTIVGFFQGKSSKDYQNPYTISVTTLQAGFSYYPKSLSLGSMGRVHIGYNIGAYLGRGKISETIMGSEPNIGIDFLISKRFIVGPLLSFHLIGDFRELDKRDLNYSGTVLSIRLALCL